MLFNAVPLLILAALYLAVGLAVAPALWRERGQARGIGFATALIFPCVGLAAAVAGVDDAGHPRGARPASPLIALLGIVLAALPLVAVARNWRDLGLLVTGPLGAAREPEAAGVAPRPRARRSRPPLASAARRRPAGRDRAGPPGRADRALRARCREPRARRGRRPASDHHLRAGGRRGQRAAARPVGLAERGGRPASARSFAKAPRSRCTTPRALRS